MPDRAEGGCNRGARADALPVRCREVVERHQCLAVFLEAQGRLWIRRVIGREEQVQGCLDLPDCV